MAKERLTTITVTRRKREVAQRCPVCRETFWGSPLKAYCSKACKNKADYQKHASERREQRRKAYQEQKEQAG